MTPACDQCRFFHLWNDPPADTKPQAPIAGECRRNPPQVGEAYGEDLSRNDRRMGVFPRVLIFDWCGEFQLRQERDDSCLTRCGDVS